LCVCPPRPLQPLEDRFDRKFAHSLRLVFADDYRAGGAEAADDERVPGGFRAEQGERAGGGLHPVGRIDVVLDEDRDPVERAPRAFFFAFAVELAGDAQGVGVRLDDRVQSGSAAVDLVDPLQVKGDEAFRRFGPRGHHVLKLRDRLLLERESGRGGLLRGALIPRPASNRQKPGKDEQDQEPRSGQSKHLVPPSSRKIGTRSGSGGPGIPARSPYLKTPAASTA
jgi:hypothetical protein